MYRFVGRRKFFIKGDKRYCAILEDKTTGVQYATNKHFRRAVEADAYGKRTEEKMNLLKVQKSLRETREIESLGKQGGLIGSEEAVGVPGIIQSPAPA